LERERFAAQLALSALVDKVWPTDANFVLIDCHDADRFMANGIAAGLIVRDLRGNATLPRSLRISVGTREENDALLRAVGAT
jgi:histidinol-phosphate/aromatic aminotransferase/cobyric acid decarboxylase-like protein